MGTIGTIAVRAPNRSAAISKSGDTSNFAVFSTHHRGYLAHPPPQIFENKNDPAHTSMIRFAQTAGDPRDGGAQIPLAPDVESRAYG